MMGKGRVHNVDEVVIVGCVDWLLNWFGDDWLWDVCAHDVQQTLLLFGYHDLFRFVSHLGRGVESLNLLISE